MMSPGLFKDGIRDPGYGPNLSSVRMAAELEVDTGLLGLLQMVGLVVEHEGETVQAFNKVLQRASSALRLW